MARATQSRNVACPGSGSRAQLLLRRMPPSPDPLPIEPALPQLRQALARRGCRAPGAAGRGQDHPGAARAARRAVARQGRRIVMLEPRSASRPGRRSPHGGGLWARSRAAPSATGSATRRGSARTRIEVVTEGVLTRMLLTDPALERVRAGHLRRVPRAEHPRRPRPRAHAADARRPAERSSGSGHVGHARRRAVAALLGGAPIVTSEGRSFPSRPRYVRPREGSRLEASVAGAVRDGAGRARGRHPRLPRRAAAKSARAAVAALGYGGATSSRSMARCRRRCRTARSARASPAAARWCSPPPSPRPVSPSTASASSWMAASRACPATRPGAE